MTIELTDAQIVRVLHLSAKIAEISREIPLPPWNSTETNLAVASALRASFELHNDELLELGALLR